MFRLQASAVTSFICLVNLFWTRLSSNIKPCPCRKEKCVIVFYWRNMYRLYFHFKMWVLIQGKLNIVKSCIFRFINARTSISEELDAACH